MAFEYVIISSIFFIASGFSILETTPILLLFLLSIFLNEIRSCACLTKERASHSIFSFSINVKSFLSLGVKHGSEIFVFGRLTPLNELKTPGTTTLVIIWSFLFDSTTFNFNLPSSIKMFSPAETSFAKDL